jgi:sulfotransferase
MQKHFKRPFKCIVLLRDLMDVLASYMQWYTENPSAFPNRYNFKNDDEKLSEIMNSKGAVAKDLEAIKNSYNYPGFCHYVKYDDLVAQPEQEFKKIYEFLGEPYFNHRFEDLQQVEVNGMKYDDTIVGKNMHNIRSVVRKVNNPYIDKIPERIRQKYEHIRF